MSGPPPSAADVAAFVSYLSSSNAKDFDGAVKSCERDGSTGNPALEMLFSRLAVHADRQQQALLGNVYDSGVDAFELFIKAGGNVGLYEAVEASVLSSWLEVDTAAAAAAVAAAAGVSGEDIGWSLLDIGPGTGKVVVPAVRKTPKESWPASLTLVEPSAAMLAPALEALAALGMTAAASSSSSSSSSSLATHNCTLQQFAAERDAAPQSGPRFDLVQATFALHNLPPADRDKALRWLCQNCQRLLLVEFDPNPLLTDRTDAQLVSSERAGVALESFTRGVAEYMQLGEDGLRVIDGFLVPILLGYFDPTAASATFEQPISSWEEDLRKAGFEGVRKTKLFDYWSADAYVVEATAASGALSAQAQSGR